MPPRNVVSADALNFTWFSKKDLEICDVLKFYDQLQRIEPGYNLFSATAFFVFDYTRLRHILLHGQIEQVIGYHPEDFLQGGLDFFSDVFHKEDFKIFNRQCMPIVHDLFKKSSHTEHSNYVFEMNYRVRNSNKGFTHVLQKGRYITDKKTSLPIYSFGMCTDITQFKKDTCISQIIKKYAPSDNNSILKYVDTNYFYPVPEDTTLTKKEREILLWMAEGLSSKQIAGKVYASENTISNHRKNMLKKTNAKNVAELIRYAMKANII